MHQHIVWEPDGRVVLGRNSLTGEERFITIPRFCHFNPVADDMAFCHPGLQRGDGQLRVIDAENAWFVRVDSVREYGDDPFLEKTTIKPDRPLLFLNIDAEAEATALIWDHIEDEPGKPCPNPRVILPRDIVPQVVDKPVSVDIRSFGIRTPKCSAEKPSYGIIGMFHILPPALAWLWRLVSPRGHNNPSIIGSGLMESEGVGSYWPFATGKRIVHANMPRAGALTAPSAGTIARGRLRGPTKRQGPSGRCGFQVRAASIAAPRRSSRSSCPGGQSAIAPAPMPC